MVTPGPGVDVHGAPVVDPTENVLALVEAAVRRQDDLREMAAAHTREIAALRATHLSELLAKESARLDAIRAVDVAAVSRAAEVVASQASTLATVVASTAETLRAAQATALEPIIKRIEELSRVQYEQAGKSVATAETKGGNQWAVGLAISLVVAVVSVVGLVATLIAK